MKFITNNEQLIPFLPNSFATVKGEATWFEKLEHYLIDAENWLFNEIIGDAYRSVDWSDLKRAEAADIIRSIIAAEALANGAPALDLVMTPNGFGIVSTSTLAPASKDRVDRLVASLIRQRDQRITDLQYAIEGDEEYKGGADGIFFSTLFRHISDVCAFGVADYLFISYLEKLPIIRQKEDYIAQNWVSPSLMERLRSVRRSDMTVHDIRLRRAIKGLVVRMAEGERLQSQEFADVTEYLRRHADEIPEWANSETAARFENSIVYKNEKEDKGYWF